MTTKPTPRSAYALIIGIDRYADPRAPNLRGCRNDAIAFYNLCRRDLCIPAAHITVAASPPLTAQELGFGAEEATLVDAAGATLRQAVQALSDKLANGHDVGLLTYSGHGVVIHPASSDSEEEADTDLCLCPADTQVNLGDQITGAIGYRELHGLIDDKARKNLTVLLDTCHSGVTSDGSHRHLLGNEDRAAASLTALRKLLEKHAHPIGSRTLLAANHGEPAEEILTADGYRGAVSHCASTLLLRWQRRAKDGVFYYDVSHEEWLFRLRKLIDTLGLQQRPQLLGTAAVVELPVLAPGMKSRPGETSRTPNRKGHKLEFPINPNKIALCYLMQATGTSRTTAYWFIAYDPTSTTVNANSLETLSFQHRGNTYYVSLGGSEAWYERWAVQYDPGRDNAPYEMKWVVAAMADTVEDLQNDADAQKYISYWGSTEELSPVAPIAEASAGEVTFTNSPVPPSPGTANVDWFSYTDVGGNDWYLIIDNSTGTAVFTWGVPNPAGATSEYTELPAEFNGGRNSLPYNLSAFSNYTGALPGNVLYYSTS